VLGAQELIFGECTEKGGGGGLYAAGGEIVDCFCGGGLLGLVGFGLGEEFGTGELLRTLLLVVVGRDELSGIS